MSDASVCSGDVKVNLKRWAGTDGAETPGSIHAKQPQAQISLNKTVISRALRNIQITKLYLAHIFQQDFN